MFGNVLYIWHTVVGFKGLSLARAQAQSGNGVSRLWGVLAGGGEGRATAFAFAELRETSPAASRCSRATVAQQQLGKRSARATVTVCVWVYVCVCMYVCTAQYPDLSKWESVVKVRI